MITAKDLEGNYQIQGKNQEDTLNQYQGSLELAVDQNNRIHAKWLIDGSQIQTGYGFFKNNILVVHFQYEGEEKEIFHGTVVYKCITKDILDGFWSEEYGDPKYLGEERCFRVKEQILH